MAKLAELKRSGRKQVDAYEIKEEQAVYDLLADDEYAELVQDRREKGGQQLAVFRLRDGVQCALSHEQMAPNSSSPNSSRCREEASDLLDRLMGRDMQVAASLSGIAACLSGI